MSGREGGGCAMRLVLWWLDGDPWLRTVLIIIDFLVVGPPISFTFAEPGNNTAMPLPYERLPRSVRTTAPNKERITWDHM